MSIYGVELTFKEPTADQVPLTDQLVTIIKNHHQRSREHLFHLCVIAYGLRRHNLISNKGKRGGNAQGKEFKPEFKEWYEKYNLEEVYGTLGNFIHYAMSGRLLSYVAWQLDKKYIDRLPSSMTGLYACAQLLWDQGDTTTSEKRKYFYRLLTKRIKDGSGVYTTAINKHCTRKAIEALRQTDLQSQKNTTKSKQKSSKLLDLGNVKVSDDVLRFSKAGSKTGHLKLETVEKLHQAILDLVAEYDMGKDYFSFHSNLDDLKNQYKIKEDLDYGASIKEADSKRKSLTKAAAAKKIPKTKL